jgi:hypothetical protein
MLVLAGAGPGPARESTTVAAIMMTRHHRRDPDHDDRTDVLIIFVEVCNRDGSSALQHHLPSALCFRHAAAPVVSAILVQPRHRCQRLQGDRELQCDCYGPALRLLVLSRTVVAVLLHFAFANRGERQTFADLSHVRAKARQPPSQWQVRR